jgi:hypothetical protein
MQMDAIRSQGPLQRNDLELTGQNGGAVLARALKGRLGQIAHDAEDKTGSRMIMGQLLKAEAQVATGFEME